MRLCLVLCRLVVCFLHHLFIKNMRFLVSGGAGFIGSHLVDDLIIGGHEVTVLDDLSSGKEEKLNPRAIFWRGDIIDDVAVGEEKPPPRWQFWKQSKVKYNLAGFDVVIHLAAVPRVPVSWAEPERTARVNIMGTLHLLLAAERAEVKRFIYASSSSVYGDQSTLPLDETMRPMPKSPYAVEKLAGEHFVTAYGQAGGMVTISLRFFNVYGEGQDEENAYSGVLTRFKVARDTGLPPIVTGDGSQSRDFTHVSDVVAACVNASFADVPSGSVFNVANGRDIPLREAVKHFSRVFVAAGARQGDVKQTKGDPTKAENILGFKCRVPFEEGIKDLTLGREPLDDKDFLSGHQMFTHV